MNQTMESEALYALIRDVPDFPKPGIVFKDITPLLQHPQGLKAAAAHLLASLNSKQVDVVAGIESRGFLLGPMLAGALNAGFVPIRKKGKLPAETYSASYELEYGIDTVELHRDAIRPGQKVLLHDDLLATGGTAKAAVDLVEQAGGEVAHFSFLIELAFLRGRRLLEGYPVHAVLKYD
jgi:adenine phosphoribosyltransferase